MTRQAVTFARSIDQFISWGEGSEGWTEETVKSYRWTMNLTTRILGSEIDPRSITEDDLHICLSRWKHLSTSTRAIRISVWHTYFKWLAKRYQVPNASIELGRPRKQIPARKRIAPKEYAALLAACVRPEDKYLILTLGHTGIRVSEFLALEWRDVDLDQRVLTVRLGKGRKGRQVPISAPLASFLASYKPEGAKERDRLVSWGKSNPRKRITYLAQKAGVRGPIACHDFRRYFAREYSAKNKDIREAQQLLGHASIETTRRYSGAVEDSVLRDGMEKVFGE